MEQSEKSSDTKFQKAVITRLLLVVMSVLLEVFCDVYFLHIISTDVGLENSFNKRAETIQFIS